MRSMAWKRSAARAARARHLVAMLAACRARSGKVFSSVCSTEKEAVRKSSRRLLSESIEIWGQCG